MNAATESAPCTRIRASKCRTSGDRAPAASATDDDAVDAVDAVDNARRAGPRAADVARHSSRAVAAIAP